MRHLQVLPARDDAAAWGLPTRGEPRWPASLAVVAALALYVMLPDRLTLPLGPSNLWPPERWLLPWTWPTNW